MNKNFFIALVLIIISQTLTFFQLQSQFLWAWSKNNPLLVAILGMPISLILIYFTKYCASAFNGEVWPGRLIGFAVGAIIFALMSHFFLKEPINTKTTVCLVLAASILTVQIFWK
jgi:hypothetical protein